MIILLLLRGWLGAGLYHLRIFFFEAYGNFFRVDPRRMRPAVFRVEAKAALILAYADRAFRPLGKALITRALINKLVRHLAPAPCAITHSYSLQFMNGPSMRKAICSC